MATKFFGALVDILGRRPLDRDIEIWAKTEFGTDANWAKSYYYRTGRFPSGRDFR
jgi:hypothetical protein